MGLFVSVVSPAAVPPCYSRRFKRDELKFEADYSFGISNNYTMRTLPLERTTRHGKHALNAHNKKSSCRRCQKEKHKAHLLPNPNAKCPQKKRRNDQYMNGDKFATTLGLITREKCCNQNAIINDTIQYCSICREDYSYLSKSDEFIEGLKGHMKNCRKDLGTRKTKEKPSMEFFKALESFVNEDFHNSSETSRSLSSKNEDMELNQPQKSSLASKTNHIPRPVIPIGPNFQAEVPKWEGTTNVRHHNSDDDLKWLGTQLWPMPDFTKSNVKGIGEGRPDSCSCEFPGSIDCVRLHVSEARQLLKLEIGTTFSSWKFDKMGEDVSKSWTLKEQKEFESIVKLNPLSKDTNFWKLAIEHFPSKSMKCLVNYYHNVYIPRCLSLETRSFLDAVDSDDDQDEKYCNKDDFSFTGIIIVHVVDFVVYD
ncbi:hypothetical protein VNO77_20512 [Canavalia gladiata]|uniref:ELM2 domain-containing protein n=1 Tax=Canavalia gladiata TaxID=3824 RepID=A0AAN9LPP4_CANGL